MRLQLWTWLVEGLHHLGKDVLAASLCLHECLLENLVRETVALDVHLRCSKAIGRSGRLEVHIAEVILVTKDVGKDGVLVFARILDKAHCNTTHGSLDGHACVHQCQATGTSARHRAGAVTLEYVAYHTDCVGEVVRQLTFEAAPSKMAVTNLATTYAALCLCLACREGREVIVQQELLVFTDKHIVDELLVELCAERTCCQRLCLTTCEDGTAVRSGQRAYLAPDGANIGSLTAVEANAFVQDAATHSVLLHIVIVTVDKRVLLFKFFGSHIGMSLGVSGLEVLADSLESLSTCLLLEALLRNVVCLLIACFLDSFAKFVVVYLVAVLALHVLAKLFAELLLEAAHGLDGLVSGLEGSEEVGLLHFLHLAFHHHDVLFGSSDHEVHVGLLELLEGGIDDELAVDTSHANLRDRSFEGDITASQCCRSGKASQSIRHVHTVGREKDNIHIHFSMIVAGEKWAQSAVHKATSQYLVVICLTLTLRETAGKTSGSKILLSVLNL